MKNSVENYSQKRNVHKVLAHSYSMYFILFLVGITLDIIFNFQILTSSVMTSVGFSIIIFASLLILWAQTTSRNLKKQNITKETFLGGPYSYTRSPTHWGLFFLMIGFGIIVNAIFIILTTLISFLVSRYVYLAKEEMILEEKYGEPYLEYKKMVKL